MRCCSLERRGDDVSLLLGRKHERRARRRNENPSAHAGARDPNAAPVSVFYKHVIAPLSSDGPPPSDDELAHLGEVPAEEEQHCSGARQLTPHLTQFMFVPSVQLPPVPESMGGVMHFVPTQDPGEQSTQTVPAPPQLVALPVHANGCEHPPATLSVSHFPDAQLTQPACDQHAESTD